MRIARLVALGLLLSGGYVAASGQVAGGASGDSPPVQGPVGSEERPARVSGGVMAGLLLHKVELTYPPEAKEARVSGAVVMAAKVDKTGKIVKLDVVSGPEILRDASLEAVRQWTYKPYVLNGAPVFVLTTITVNFALQP